MAKILVVDDEREFTEMLGVRLKKSGGYDVIEAFDGEEGLRLALEQAPDLIILDILLPKKDGFDVLADIRRSDKTKNIPVIILTASANPKTNKKFEAAGVEGFINKPFDPPELMNKIKALLERKI